MRVQSMLPSLGLALLALIPAAAHGQRVIYCWNAGRECGRSSADDQDRTWRQREQALDRADRLREQSRARVEAQLRSHFLVAERNAMRQEDARYRAERSREFARERAERSRELSRERAERTRELARERADRARELARDRAEMTRSRGRYIPW